MKNKIIFAAVLLSVSVAGHAAEVNFDGTAAVSANSAIDVTATLADITSAKLGDHNDFGGHGGQPPLPSHPLPYDLTPEAKKFFNGNGTGISVSTVTTIGGEVHMTLVDKKAALYPGSRITISADGMRIGTVPPNASGDDILEEFAQFWAVKTFDVARSYDLKLMDNHKRGKYTVSLFFYRSGANTSGASGSMVERFEIK